jgi:hypothetical protein
MCKRDGVDAARDVIQCAMDLRAFMPTLLNGDGGQNQLKVILDAMLGVPSGFTVARR